MAGGAANAAASQRTGRPAFQRLLLRAGRCLILFHVKRSQSECSARYKRAPGACTYCADLNTSAIRAHALLVTHRVDQVDAPNHRFTHRSYEKHRQRAHRMQQALSLLVGIHSSFNVGRALEGSLQLCRLPHASTPRESSPARQRLTLRKAVSRETKSFFSTASYAVRDRTDTTAIIRRHSPRGGAPRRTAYEPNCSHPEHRLCAACRRLSQVCWIPQRRPVPCFT